MILLVVASHLLGQHSLSPDELKDAHIGRIACPQKLHAQLHAHAIWPKIACACNFLCMQSCRYGCLSTRLNLRNAVLGDEQPQLNKVLLVCETKKIMEFPLSFF